MFYIRHWLNVYLALQGNLELLARGRLGTLWSKYHLSRCRYIYIYIYIYISVAECAADHQLVPDIFLRRLVLGSAEKEGRQKRG